MPFTVPWKKKKRGKPQDVSWEDQQDPFCVAAPGWEDETTELWDCTMCKKYVKMTHLSKLWDAEEVVKQAHRWEGKVHSCKSEHFKQRYQEVKRAVQLPDSKPKIMNYSLMAMVWAEIVLQKNVDWRTVQGKNVAQLRRNQVHIDTAWTTLSDCIPEWSNRGRGHLPPVVLPDAEDNSSDDDDIDDIPPQPPSEERHERREAREDIEYEQQLQEAIRRSREDRGAVYGPRDRSYEHDRGTHGSQGGGSSSHYTPEPRLPRSQSHGPSYYGGSSRGGSQYYSGSTGGGYYGTTQHGGYSGGGSQEYHGFTPYGHSNEGGFQQNPPFNVGGSYGYHGGSYHSGSSEGGSQRNVPIPPPTFGGSSYGSYGQGGGSSTYRDTYGGGPYIGIQRRRTPKPKEDTDSGSE